MFKPVKKLNKTYRKTIYIKNTNPFSKKKHNNLLVKISHLRIVFFFVKTKSSFQINVFLIINYYFLFSI